MQKTIRASLTGSVTESELKLRIRSKLDRLRTLTGLSTVACNRLALESSSIHLPDLNLIQTHDCKASSNNQKGKFGMLIITQNSSRAYTCESSTGLDEGANMAYAALSFC